jgi:hypothetical protein
MSVRKLFGDNGQAGLCYASMERYAFRKMSFFLAVLTCLVGNSTSISSSTCMSLRLKTRYCCTMLKIFRTVQYQTKPGGKPLQSNQMIAALR